MNDNSTNQTEAMKIELDRPRRQLIAMACREELRHLNKKIADETNQQARDEKAGATKGYRKSVLSPLWGIRHDLNSIIATMEKE